MIKKLTSMKLLTTIWAMGIVSFIVIADRTAFLDVAKYLAVVPVAYIGANVWQKKIISDKEVKNETESD